MLDRTPTALTLRYLQTLVEIGAEKNSTTIFPIPIDLFRPFMEKATLGAIQSAVPMAPLAAPPAGE